MKRYLKYLILFCILLFSGISVFGQNTCASPTIVGTLPYNLSSTTDGTGDDYNQNDACVFIKRKDHGFVF